jgi:hypothetical protein
MINMSSATNAKASMISRREIAALMKRGLPLAGAQWAKVWVRNTNIAKYKGILLQLAEGVGFEPLVRAPVTTRSNVVAQKRLAFVLDWSGTALTPVPEALGPAPQRMWLRGALS